MRSRPRVLLLLTLAAAPLTAQTTTTPAARFEPMDVFGLELGADPRISPDGERVVFVRTYFDVMKDATRSNLWILPYGGGEARPLTTGGQRDASPRWSPDGRMVAYVSNEEDGSQVWLRWMDTGETAKLTSLVESPGGLAWSPDGKWLAFTMFVPEEDQPLRVDMPKAPEGADWGPSWTYIDELTYRSDGSGYIRPGHRHLFVLPAEGGTPRQVTSGPYDHGAPSWTPDGRALVFSANRHEDRERVPRNSEIWRLHVATGALAQLTDRFGPDGSPAMSPDGRRIAFTGYDDAFQGYQTTRLYVMDADGSNRRELAAALDRSIGGPVWSADGRGLFVDYDSEGTGRLAFVDLDGRVTELADRVGGTSLGRPYSGGSWSVARNGRFAFTRSAPDRPAEVAVGERRRPHRVRPITDLNADVLAHKELGVVEEIWYRSSYDGRRIHGWIIRPPGFDPARKYPLILEIHGGPFAAYGPSFAAELQLYAAAGYVVLYTNPRGSTSYGQEFGNLIHHAYPSQDYDDLMSGVDAVIDRGYVDPDRLFVTGGSGGGVLSAWIVGKTDRFRAAVVQKPVINWYSFVLYADNPATFYRYWFPGPPWEHLEHYMARSPLSLVGNVSTPTMLITGEEDHRTPIPESEQYYAALQIRGVPSALVRVPDAGHGIANKPSNLIEKVAYVLGWFGKWDAAASASPPRRTPLSPPLQRDDLRRHRSRVALGVPQPVVVEVPGLAAEQDEGAGGDVAEAGARGGRGLLPWRTVVDPDAALPFGRVVAGRHEEHALPRDPDGVGHGDAHRIRDREAHGVGDREAHGVDPDQRIGGGDPQRVHPEDGVQHRPRPHAHRVHADDGIGDGHGVPADEGPGALLPQRVEAHHRVHAQHRVEPERDADLVAVQAAVQGVGRRVAVPGLRHDHVVAAARGVEYAEEHGDRAHDDARPE